MQECYVCELEEFQRSVKHDGLCMVYDVEPGEEGAPRKQVWSFTVSSEVFEVKGDEQGNKPSREDVLRLLQEARSSVCEVIRKEAGDGNVVFLKNPIKYYAGFKRMNEEEGRAVYQCRAWTDLLVLPKEIHKRGSCTDSFPLGDLEANMPISGAFLDEFQNHEISSAAAATPPEGHVEQFLRERAQQESR